MRTYGLKRVELITAATALMAQERAAIERVAEALLRYRRVDAGSSGRCLDRSPILLEGIAPKKPFAAEHKYNEQSEEVTMFSAFRNTMGMTSNKRIARAAALGVAMLIEGGISAPTAQAGLIDAQVTYDYLFPDTSTIHSSLPTQTITSSTSLVDSTGIITTTFTNNEIIITNENETTFAFTLFNGPSYLFSGVTISNVTIDSLSDLNFAQGRPSFTANDIMVNLAGLEVGSGAQLILDVTTPPAVPEPASLTLLAAGLAGLGVALRRRA